MDLRKWDVIYQQIVRDFGYDCAKDELSALILSYLLTLKGNFEEAQSKLRHIIRQREVLVCGKAPTLVGDIKNGKIETRETIIAADGATSVLLAQGVIPHIIVSDLDGSINDLKRANAMCAIMVIHAHGDNIDAIKTHVPSLSTVIGTTQAKPLKNVLNVGGFTDGDRAVFFAKEFGARVVSAIGFDFSDNKVSPTKKKKLLWAKQLLEGADVNFK
ncbi:MAG: 6-hydroxymethylpterin diphosphokinase MptE-like protein [Halobacteriota archaeon]